MIESLLPPARQLLAVGEPPPPHPAPERDAIRTALAYRARANSLLTRLALQLITASDRRNWIGAFGHERAEESRDGQGALFVGASVAPPNGSRLSCGRRARWRKALERQKKRLAGEATQFLPTCARPAASSAC